MQSQVNWKSKNFMLSRFVSDRTSCHPQKYRCMERTAKQFHASPPRHIVLNLGLSLQVHGEISIRIKWFRRKTKKNEPMLDPTFIWPLLLNNHCCSSLPLQGLTSTVKERMVRNIVRLSVQKNVLTTSSRIHTKIRTRKPNFMNYISRNIPICYVFRVACRPKLISISHVWV